MYEDGAVFSPKVLDIKPEDLLQRFMEGIGKVAAISLQIGYPTVASVPHSLVNGFKRLLAVAVATNITFPEAEQASVTPIAPPSNNFTISVSLSSLSPLPSLVPG